MTKFELKLIKWAEKIDWKLLDKQIEYLYDLPRNELLEGVIELLVELKMREEQADLEEHLDTGNTSTWDDAAKKRDEIFNKILKENRKK